MKGLHLLIFGTVQGVFFRKATLQKATELKLTGWVRNRKEGTVEVQAEGSEEALIQLLQWCGKGPPRSKVEKVRTQWSKFSGQFTSFEIHQSV